MSLKPEAPAGAESIPLAVPEIRGNEWRYVRECLDSNWVSSAGPFVDRFEQTVAAYVGAKYAVATSSGTAALHVALRVAGVGPDDEVLLPALTFIAPANTVRYVGAWPVFVDVEPAYWQIDPQRVADFLAKKCRARDGVVYNAGTGRRVKAVLPVHLLGHPADADPIREVARRHGLVVVEDAAESLGARYKGRRVGGAGEVACLSFNGNKVVTCGGGGMVLTNDPAWAAKIKYLTTQAKDDEVEYVHNEVGYNYRLTNLQAAVGLAQLERLDAHVEAKRRIAEGYRVGLRSVPGVRPMAEAPWAFSTCWLFTARIEEEEFGHDSRSLLRWLAGRGIQARPLWQPLHRSAAHAGSQMVGGEVADRLYREALSLPSSVGLTAFQQDAVLRAIAARLSSRD